MSKPLAVVTGANRGMGRETAHQLAKEGYHVIMAVRDPRKAHDVLNEFLDEGLSVEVRKVDVSSTQHCKALAEWLREHHKGVDVLVNNAAILPESSSDASGRYPANPLFVPSSTLMEILNVNTLGTIRMIQALATQLNENARVVNVSSSMGQLSADWATGHLGYRMSKTAVNAVTKMFADVLAPKHIKVNSVDPGWVRTDMGSPNAPRSIEDGAASILWAARLGPDGPSGGFFRDGKPLDW
jgi:NAD(P)-dependent dehydrogenase (short-subunit alcohol dehydrogenase family)